MSRASAEPFETLRAEPSAVGPVHLVRLEAHLARLARTCAYLGIPFTPTRASEALRSAVEGLSAPSRVRLLYTRDGAPRVSVAPAPPSGPEPVLVGVALERTDESDPLRRHKTTARELYDLASARAAEAGLGELVFLNRRGNMAEGAISNLFVARDGMLVTPPVGAGALPGVLRGELIAEGRCVEGDVTLEELEVGEFYIGNSLRGLRRAVLAPGITVLTGNDRPNAGRRRS